MVEVAAASKWKEDEGPKRALYERLGVREYWQLDPRGEYLPSRLQGWRLRGGVYEPQTVEEPLDGMLMLHSETLGLDLLASQSGELYFCDPVSGERLLGHRETEAARRVAEARAKQAAAAREAEAAGRRLAEARVEQEVATRQAKAARRRLADSPAEGFAAVRQAEADARRWAEEWIAEARGATRSRQARLTGGGPARCLGHCATRSSSVTLVSSNVRTTAAPSNPQRRPPGGRRRHGPRRRSFVRGRPRRLASGGEAARRTAEARIAELEAHLGLRRG